MSDDGSGTVAGSRVGEDLGAVEKRHHRKLKLWALTLNNVLLEEQVHSK